MLTKERLSYWVIIAVLIILMLLQRQCQRPCPGNQLIIKSDTTFIHDTVDVPTYKPVPVSVITKSRVKPVEWMVDTSGAIVQKPQPVDTSVDIISTYSDTIKLATPLAGSVIINDTVDGTIRARKIKHDYYLPVAVNNTFTTTNPPRTQLYVGAELLGSQQTFLNYGGVSLGIKSKKDVFYEVKALGPLQGGPPLFGIGVKTKISFRPF